MVTQKNTLQQELCSQWSYQMALGWGGFFISDGLQQIQLRLVAGNTRQKEMIHLLHWLCERIFPVEVHSLNQNDFFQEVQALYVNQRQDRLLKDFSSQTASGSELDNPPSIKNSIDQYAYGSVADLVNQMLIDAIDSIASDLHMDPSGTDEGALVRYRIDGCLVPRYAIPMERYLAIIARIKILADLDTSEVRRPQDGRIKLLVMRRSIDLRVSFIPVGSGERVVIRILDTEAQRLGLDRLGISEEMQGDIRQLLAKKSGLILVTGPTGSGKTTTLYSMVQELSTPKLNIMTIEDPVEYILPGIAQMPVNPKIGVTFSTGLRHLLRQDPDILLVGEIRDLETAEIALQASLTGHLVLSTLHTEDAPSAIIRLHEMGIPPYLISGSIRAILAQRLVRKKMKVTEENGVGGGGTGRIGIFELLTIDSQWQEILSSENNYSHLRAEAKRLGHVTLADHGKRLIQEGIIEAKDLFEVIDPF